MELTISPTFARLTGRISSGMTAALCDLLRYRVDSQYFMQRKLLRFQCRRAAVGGPCTLRRGHRGECVHVDLEPKYLSLAQVKPDGIVFPSGLAHRVLKATGEIPVHRGVEPVWAPVVPIRLASPLPDGLALHADQLRAVEVVMRESRGLLNLATNFGKGVLIAGLCHAYGGANILIIVTGTTPLIEGHRFLEERLRRSVGRIGAGRQHLDPRCRIHIATIQTLHRQRRTAAMATYLQDVVDLLIVDEGDLVTPTQWFPVLGACQAPIRISMSGSMRDAPHPIVTEAFFGPVLMDVKDAELVAAGRSAQPTVLMPNVGTLLSESSDYDEVYGPGIARNATRNALFTEAAGVLARHGLRTLGIFYRLEHGERLMHLMEAHGLRVALVRGDSPPSARRRAIDDLASRRLDVVLGSNIFIRQLDAPHVEAVFNLAGWRSVRATGQKAGRGLRRKGVETANRVLLLDPYDLGNGLLRRHSEARRVTYARKGFVVSRGAWEALRGDLEAWAAGTRADAPAVNAGAKRLPS